MRVEWKFVSTIHTELFVMISGTLRMLKLSVGSSIIHLTSVSIAIWVSSET